VKTVSAVNIYEKLREKISSWPVRVPKTKEVDEMLKVLFTEEEAEFLTHFTAPYQDGQTVDQIAEKIEKPREKVQAIVDRLVSRGLLFKFASRRDNTVYYTLMPLIPGIFEFYFASGRDSDEKRKVAELFEKYYLNGFGMEIGASNYPAMRVVPVEKTITLNTKIDAELSIFPFEKMSEFVATSRKIAVINCACRTKKKCIHPLETCVVFDASAEFMVERGFGRYLSIEEALKLLEETEKAGLVHCAMNTQTKPQFICNCCTCACLVSEVSLSYTTHAPLQSPTISLLETTKYAPSVGIASISVPSRPTYIMLNMIATPRKLLSYKNGALDADSALITARTAQSSWSKLEIRFQKKRLEKCG
jgi:DNA-binding Lrp family transcriptional regulator